MYFSFMYVSIFCGEIMADIELQSKYNALLNEYSSSMDKRALAYIRENFWKLKDSYEMPDILMQVYSELGILKDNVYLKHLEKIKNIFDINCNVLEIGGGMLPAFSNILAREQLRIGNGTVTVYDRLLATTKPKHPNMKLIKDEFTLKSDIKSFDLVLGIMPCDATEIMIQKVCEARKNFYLFMCGCNHFDFPQMLMYGSSSESYQRYIIKFANELIDGEIGIDTFENSYGLDYPVLYKKFH